MSRSAESPASRGEDSETAQETSQGTEQQTERAGSGGARSGAASETRASVLSTIAEALKTPPVGLILIELLIDQTPSGQVDAPAELHNRIERCMLGSDTMVTAGIDRLLVIKRQMAAPAETEGFALRLLNALGGPILGGDEPVTCHSAIGVAVSHAGDQPEDLLRYAEHALGDARMLGGDMVVFFEDADRALLPGGSQ